MVWALKEDDSPRMKTMYRAKVVAWCLHRMALDVQELKSANAEENTERTRAEQAEFLTRHERNKIGDDFTFPSKMEAFPCPELGPLVDTGENELESYNRCWEVLRYIAGGFYKQNWKNRFATSEAVNRGTFVNLSHAPSWMQPASQEVHSGLASVSKSFPADSWSPITVHVRWIHRLKDRHYQNTVSALEEAKPRGETIPLTRFKFPWDPRIFNTVQQFRDYIRQSMNCSSLGLDLQSISVKYHCEGDDPDNIMEVNGFSQDWKELKEIFHDPKHAQFVLEVCLKPFDTNDPTYSLYEDVGNPIDKNTCLAIAKSLKEIFGNDKENESILGISAELGETVPKQKCTPVPEKSADLEGIIQFAQSEVGKDGYGATPRQFETKEKQIAFYNGYDVDTPEGRLDWQYSLINNIAPRKENAISTDKLPSDLNATETEIQAFGQAEQDAHHAGEAEVQPKVSHSPFYLI